MKIDKWKLHIKKIKWNIALLFIFYLIIPILSAFWLFWYDVKIPINFERKTEIGNEYLVEKNKLFEPGLKNSIRNSIQSPFNLSGIANLNICFYSSKEEEINTDGKIVNTKFIGGKAIVYINDQEPKIFEFEANREINCRSINLDSTSKIIVGVANPKFSYSITIFPSRMHLTPPEIIDKATPYLWDKILSTIIFIFAYWTFMFLIEQIYKKTLPILKYLKKFLYMLFKINTYHQIF